MLRDGEAFSHDFGHLPGQKWRRGGSDHQSAMPVELKYMELAVQSDVALPIFYRGQKIHNEGFRIDLVVEETVIIELRTTVAAKETN